MLEDYSFGERSLRRRGRERVLTRKKWTRKSTWFRVCRAEMWQVSEGSDLSKESWRLFFFFLGTVHSSFLIFAAASCITSLWNHSICWVTQHGLPVLLPRGLSLLTCLHSELSPKHQSNTVTVMGNGEVVLFSGVVNLGEQTSCFLFVFFLNVEIHDLENYAFYSVPKMEILAISIRTNMYLSSFYSVC